MQRAREVFRQWSPPSWWPVPGPYTSVFVTDGSGFGWMPVTAQTALAVNAVYSALGYYADLIGTMPVRRYRGEWEQLPAPPFVAQPAGTPMGWTDEIGQVIWSLLLRGNAYLVPTSLDWTGYPATFWVASPDQVEVSRLESGRIEYRIRWDGNRADDLVFINPSPDQLLHLRWQRPPGSFLGVGILDAAGGPGGSLAAATATQRYASDLMANPTPPAVLTHPLRLNAQQASDLQAQWAASVGRARAVPAVLSGGITYQPLTVSASDVQLIESQRWNATAVATLFKLPAYYLGGDTGSSMTYATVEGENTRLWTDALQPMAVRLQRGIGGAWCPNGQRLKFVPDAYLRSQTLDRYQAHKIALDAGFKTVDEVRALEDLPPLETEPLAAASQVTPPAPPPALPPGGAPP